MKDKQLKCRFIKEIIFKYLINISIFCCAFILLWILFNLIKDSYGWINLNFLFNFPSRIPRECGILPGLLGSLFIISIVFLTVVPIGLGTALFLEEYTNKKKMFSRFINICVYNLSGIPSVIYGVLGMYIFSYFTFLKGTIIAGAISLMLLVLPVIIISSQEIIKTIPNELKEAAYSLGMSKVQVIKAVIIPMAFPGCLTGVILSLSRAIGEAVPLIIVGAVTIVTTLPLYLDSSFTALPILVYYWSSLPNADFQHLAASGSIVLIFILILFNIIVVLLKNKFNRR